MKTHLHLALALAAFTFLGAGPARAGDAARAQALFEEGRELMAKNDLGPACAKLEASLKLDAAAGTEYNLATCYERSGRYASAWATYLNVAAQYKATGRADWEEKARGRAAAVAAQLSRLVVHVPKELGPVKVTRDGSPIESAELGTAMPVDAGAHVVEARAEDGRVFREEVSVAVGATATLAVRFDGAVAAGPAAPSSVAPIGPALASSPPLPPSSTQRTVGFVVGGVGGVALAGGAVFALLAMNENATSKRDCPESGPCASQAALDANAAARDWAAASTVTFAVGGALVAGAIALVLTAPTAKVATGARGPALRIAF